MNLKKVMNILYGSEKTNLRTMVVIEEILNCLKLVKEDYILVLKLHPKDEITKYKKYLDKFDKILKDVNPLEAIFFSDYIIGMTTNLLIEAALMNKEVISIIPRKKEVNWLPDAVYPSIPTFYNRSDLNNMFKNCFRENLKII